MSLYDTYFLVSRSTYVKITLYPISWTMLFCLMFIKNHFFYFFLIVEFGIIPCPNPNQNEMTIELNTSIPIGWPHNLANLIILFGKMKKYEGV